MEKKKIYKIFLGRNSKEMINSFWERRVIELYY